MSVSRWSWWLGVVLAFAAGVAMAVHWAPRTVNIPAAAQPPASAPPLPPAIVAPPAEAARRRQRDPALRPGGVRLVWADAGAWPQPGRKPSVER
jgi:hypothetical protein